MQRGLNEEAKRELEDIDNNITANENWSLKITCHVTKDKKYNTFQEYITCLPLRYGRMSFGGFNKPLEKLLAEAEVEEDGVESDGASIGDEEMAEHFSAVNETVAKKFKRKSDRGKGNDEDEAIEAKKRKTSTNDPTSMNPRPKFLKPTL